MLSIPVRDMSSGFRLYRREALRELKLKSENLEVQEEILVRAYARGFSVIEVPFVYFPRRSGRSHTRLIRFGFDILLSSLKLWKVRNSLESSDYDERGFYSIIPIQRYWHRSRHRIAVNWARGSGRILDAGCGSSLIVQSLNNAVGMDFNLGKLRFLRRYGMPLVRGSAFALPFADNSFDCVVSQEVIEHLPYDEVIFEDMRRVLKPGGIVILGTPDYDSLGLAHHRAHLRLPDARRLQGRAHHPLHPRQFDRNHGPPRLRRRRSRLRRPQRPPDAMPQAGTSQSRRHHLSLHRRLTPHP